MSAQLMTQNCLTSEDLTRFEWEGISDDELVFLYHLTFDRLQKILILEIAKHRKLDIPLEQPKEAA